MGIVRRDSIRMTVLSYIGAAIGYMNTLLLFPHFLQPEQIGLAVVLLAVGAVYAQSSTLGSNLAIIKFFPYFNDKKSQHNGLFFWCLLTALIGYSLFTLVFLFFKDNIIHFYSPHSPLFTDYYYYIIPVALSYLMISLLDSYLRMLYKNIIIVVLNEVVIRVFTTISIILYGLHFVSFHRFVTIYIGLNCMVGLLALVYVIYLKQFFIQPIVSPQWKKLKRHIFNYAGFTYANVMANVYLSNLDVLMVAGFASLYSTGIYSTVASIAIIMLIPYRAVVKIASSTVAYHWRHKDLAAIQKMYVRVSEINFIIGGVLFLLIWINLRNILHFMRPAFMAGIPVFLFVGIGRFIDVVTGLNGYILLFSNKYRIDLLFSVFLFAISFLLNWWLIPIYGMTGAAISTLFILTSYNGLRIWYVWQQFRLFPFTTRYILPVVWLAILCVAGWYMPFLSNVFIDGGIKTIAVGVLFLLPLYYWRFSPDFTIWVNKHLAHYLNWKL